MIRIAICDDEKYYREKIEKQVSKILGCHQMNEYEMKTYESGESLCEIGDDLCEYQIFFLDINMQGANGLETAQRIREVNKEAFIVFITAYIDYAMEGYKVEAIRFILKDMLERMLEECMNTILQKLQLQNKFLQYAFLEGDIELCIEDILYVESKLHKLIFHMLSSKTTQYSIYGKLDMEQEVLEPYGFLRIHKSYLVNMKHISRIERYQVLITTQTTLPIPRDKYQIVEENYYDYKGKML